MSTTLGPANVGEFPPSLLSCEYCGRAELPHFTLERDYVVTDNDSLVVQLFYSIHCPCSTRKALRVLVDGYA